MNESRALANFVAELTYEALSNEVVEKAKTLIFDQVGVMLGASTLPWSRIINDYVKDWGSVREECTVANYGYKTKAENAVFANASFCHGFEFDDIYIYGNSHPGCIVVPTALAMGERERISGRELIVAVVAGYEVMGRINSAMTPSCASRGFHAPTSITGPFGAAAAVGKILKFDSELMLNALAIAGSHSAGITEYDQGGGSVKRMHAGMAAHGGVRSAFLAQKGLTGPATVLEGKHGTFSAFTDSHNALEITDKLGEEFKVVMGTGFKAYCACAPIHAAIDALQTLMRNYNITPDKISRITMGTNRRSITHVEAPPKDILSAQFSAAFSLALTAIRGSNGFQDYTEQTLHDEEILRMADKVTLEIDKDVDREYPATRAARVTVRLVSGAEYQAKVDHCKGTPQNPLSGQDLERKFLSLATAAIPEERAEAIIRFIRSLEQQTDLSVLVSNMSAC
jgi:2-methylcitrate dehydratase PrpD